MQTDGHKRWKRKTPPVPAYQVSIKRLIEPLLNIVSKGLILDSEHIMVEALPDGRVRLRLRPGISLSLGGGTPARPLPARPTNLNLVIATGVIVGLWPVPGVTIPTTLNEVITAGVTTGLWPTSGVLTPTTLKEVIAAGTALHLWL